MPLNIEFVHSSGFSTLWPYPYLRRRLPSSHTSRFGSAGEILQLWPLLLYHIRNLLFCRTDKDGLRATSPGTLSPDQTLPHLQLYFLMDLVYLVITPVIMPFIIIFLAFGFVVYRYEVYFLLLFAPFFSKLFWNETVLRIPILIPVLIYSRACNVLPF